MATRRKGGWPKGGALAAATALHAAILALLLADWRGPPPSAAPRVLPVELVQIEPPERNALEPPPAAQPPAEPPAAAESTEADASVAAEAASPAASAAEATAQDTAADGPAGNTPAKVERAENPAASAAEATARDMVANAPVVAENPPAKVEPAESPDHAAAKAHAAPRKKAAPQHQRPRAPPLDGVAVYSVVLEPSGRIRDVVLVQSSGNTAFDQAGERMIRATMHFPAAPGGQGDGVGYYAVSLKFTPDAR